MDINLKREEVRIVQECFFIWRFLSFTGTTLPSGSSIKIINKFFSKFLILPCGQTHERQNYFAAKSVISAQIIVSNLEKNKVFNWTRATKRVTPITVPNDGNSICHACAVHVCGITDQFLHFRRALKETLDGNVEFASPFYKRWSAHMKNKHAGNLYTDSDCENAWLDICLEASLETKQNLEGTEKFEDLTQFHVFVLAHTCRRTIIVVSNEEDVFCSSIFLPVLLPPGDCVKCPIYVAYHKKFFAPLAFVDEPESDLSCHDVCVPVVDINFRMFDFPFLLPNESADTLIQKYCYMTSVSYTAPTQINLVPAVRLPEFVSPVEHRQTGIDPNSVLRKCFDVLQCGLMPSHVLQLWKIVTNLKNTFSEQASSSQQPISIGYPAEGDCEEDDLVTTFNNIEDSQENVETNNSLTDSLQENLNLVNNEYNDSSVADIRSGETSATNATHENTSVQTSTVNTTPTPTSNEEASILFVPSENTLNVITPTTDTENVNSTSIGITNSAVASSAPSLVDSSRVEAVPTLQQTTSTGIDVEHDSHHSYLQEPDHGMNFFGNESIVTSDIFDDGFERNSDSRPFVHQSDNFLEDAESSANDQSYVRSYPNGVDLQHLSQHHVKVTNCSRIVFLVFKLMVNSSRYKVIVTLEKVGFESNSELKMKLQCNRNISTNYHHVSDDSLEMNLRNPGRNIMVLDVELPNNVTVEQRDEPNYGDVLLPSADEYSTYVDVQTHPEKCRTAGCMNRRLRNLRGLCSICHEAWQVRLHPTTNGSSSNITRNEYPSSEESEPGSTGECANSRCNNMSVRGCYGFCLKCFHTPGL